MADSTITDLVIGKAVQYLGGPAVALILVKLWIKRMEEAVVKINKVEPLLARAVERLDEIEEHFLPRRVDLLEYQFKNVEKAINEIQTALDANGNLMKTLANLASSVAILLDRASRDTQGQGDRQIPGTKMDRQ